MSSEKLRWVHDCYGTQTVAGLVFRKTDAQSRSLGHWFYACPHCAKPNPYYVKATPPASHDAGEALPQMTDRQMFNIAFNLSAEFGPEFTEANREFALAAIHEYRTVTPACFEKEMRRFDSERDNLLSDVRVSHATIATLTAEVSRLTGELERSRKECEGLREAALATAGMYGRDCRESMLRAFEQAVALSAGDTK